MEVSATKRTYKRHTNTERAGTPKPSNSNQLEKILDQGVDSEAIEQASNSVQTMYGSLKEFQRQCMDDQAELICRSHRLGEENKNPTGIGD